MHKSKGRFRKFVRGLKGGNLERGELSQNAKIAEPPRDIANDDSSINNNSLKGNKDENVAKNATWTEVRTSTGAEEDESSPLSYEIEELDERDISREIWIEAYTGLQNDDGTKDLVNIYETVLSQQLKGHGEQSVVQTTNEFSRFRNNVDQKIPQMRLVTEKALSSASKHSGVADGFTKAADLISTVNGIVSPMIQSNPVAALAWGGICAALPLILRPITAESDMASGLWYVIGRMQWYMGLVRGLLDATGSKMNEQLRSQFKHRILDLYTNILTYQMQSVCYCYHDRTIMKALRAVIALDDWKARLESIQKLEAAVEKDMGSFAAVETLSSLAEIARSTKKLDIISSSLAELVTSKERARKEEEERKLEEERTFLSERVSQFRTTDYERQMKLNPIRVRGTCEWFCKHEKFKSWLSCKGSGLFLVSADPGCGKSTLARYLIEEVLPKNADATVLYFFFKDTPEQRLVSNALCAMLYQLLYRKTHITGKLKHRIPTSVPTFLSDVSALWALFEEACKDKDLGEVICVFDALDECEREGMRLLATNLDHLLQNLGSDNGKNGVSIKFLITTRGYPEILDQFSDVVSDIVYLSGDDKDEKDQIQAEIGLVLDYQLERLSEKKHFKTERKERVYEALKAKGSEQRTYLWLKLIFELLQGTFKTTTRDWEDIIAKPPSSVNKAYETLLMRVDNDDKEAVRVVLHLMIAACRPLTLCEMNIALNIRIRPEISDEDSLELSTDDEFKQWLLHTCGFFVTIYDDRVFFIHQTAKEYLLRPDLEKSRSDGDWCHSITNRNAERMIAESCIAYLSLKQFQRRTFQDQASKIQEAQLELESSQGEAAASWSYDTGMDDPFRVDSEHIDSAYDGIFTDFKLLHYALRFWTRHFRACQFMDEATMCDIGDTFFGQYLELFASNSTGPPPWLLLALYRTKDLDWHDKDRRRYRDYMVYGYSVAKVAAYYNHIRLFQHAVQQSPLQPTETGLEAGLSNNGATLLHLAIFKDCSTDFLELLASHVNVDAQDGFSRQTALCAAGFMGHCRAMDVLLNHGADAKITDCYNYSPLSHIARHYLSASPPESEEYLTLMDRLFSHGADANSAIVPPAYVYERLFRGSDSLLTAAARSTVGLAKLKTKLEAVVALRSGDINPHVSILAQAIMCPGFDLFAEPAFLDAFDESFIKFLLDHGASLEFQNETGEFEAMTALQSAYHYGKRDDWDKTFMGIAFLLYAGATPLPPSPPNEYCKPWELPPGSDFGMFLNKAASWMLLLKSLSYDPLSPPQDSALTYERHKSLLHEAVQWPCPSADWVWLMLKRGEDIEGRDEKGQTALHVACTQERLEIVNFLLEQGADIEARNNDGQTPLHVAKNAEAVRYLCAAGADANARDNEKLTPLHTITQNDLSDCNAAVETLLKHHADVSARDSRGRTPLHLACQLSGFEFWSIVGSVKAFLHYNADIDAQDAEGATPLHEACGHYSPDVVKVLLAHHADLEVRDAQGRTPIHRTCEPHAPPPSPSDYMWIPEEEVRLEILQLLLTHQTNIEAPDQQGRTPLHQTMSHGRVQDVLLKVLLEHRANIEARDALGCTPLHVACRENYQYALPVLLEHQANIEARDALGRTPLHVACRENHGNIVDMLLEHGANADARDPAGNTPAHFVCQSLCFDALDSILRHRPDLDMNAQNSSGKTALDVMRETEGAPVDNIGLLMSEFQELLWRFGC